MLYAHMPVLYDFTRATGRASYKLFRIIFSATFSIAAFLFWATGFSPIKTIFEKVVQALAVVPLGLLVTPLPAWLLFSVSLLPRKIIMPVIGVTYPILLIVTFAHFGR